MVRTFNKKVYKSYNFKTRRGVRHYRKKGKSKAARLKDSKINTLEEKAALRIARQQLVKATQYYVRRSVFIGAGFTHWSENDMWPDISQSVRIKPQDFYYTEQCAIGGYLASDLSDRLTGQGTVTTAHFKDRSLALHLKQLKFKFRALNVGLTKATLDVYIFRVPYNKEWLAVQASVAVQPFDVSDRDNPKPQMSWTKPLTTFNTICPEALAEWKQSNIGPTIGPPSVSGIEHHLIEHKRFVLPVGHMIDTTGSASNRVNTEPWRELTVQKTYAGLGRKEDYEVYGEPVPTANSFVRLQGRLSNNRYYLCIRCDQLCYLHGAFLVRFCRGKNFPDQVIFDAEAPGLPVQPNPPNP